MTNRVFINILDRRVQDFVNSFDYDAKSIFFNANNKLIHSGEYGLLKEKAVIDLLRLIVPESLDISSGFILTSDGQVSTQCDIVIYDKSRNPVIREGAANFFLVESVYAIGEVKSKQNVTQYKSTLEKLAAQKKLGKSTFPKQEFNPKTKAADNIITFLVCQKLDFDYLKPEVYKQAYTDNGVAPSDWHNIVLSIEDGELLYKVKPSVHLNEREQKNVSDLFDANTEWPWHYPVHNGHQLQYAHREIPNSDNLWHIKDFLHLLSILISEKNLTYSSTLEYFSDRLIKSKGT